MTIANFKPLFVIDDEALSDLDERSTHTEHGTSRVGRWHRFHINGVSLIATEWGTGTGRYTVAEDGNGAFQLIEADADAVMRHVDRGFPRVSGRFPPILIDTGSVPTAKANDDEDIDAMLAELGGDDTPKAPLSGDEDIDALLAELG